MKKLCLYLLCLCLIFSCLTVSALEKTWGITELPDFNTLTIDTFAYIYQKEPRHGLPEKYISDDIKNTVLQKYIIDNLIATDKKLDDSAYKFSGDKVPADVDFAIILDGVGCEWWVAFMPEYATIFNYAAYPTLYTYCEYANPDTVKEMKALLDPFVAIYKEESAVKEAEKEAAREEALKNPKIKDFKELYKAEFCSDIDTNKYIIWGICRFTYTDSEKTETGVFWNGGGSTTDYYFITTSSPVDNKVTFNPIYLYGDNIFYDKPGEMQCSIKIELDDKNNVISAIWSNSVVDFMPDMSTYVAKGDINALIDYGFVPAKATVSDNTSQNPSSDIPADSKTEATVDTPKVEDEKVPSDIDAEKPTEDKNTDETKEEIKEEPKEESKEEIKENTDKPNEAPTDELPGQSEDKAPDIEIPVFEDVPKEHWAYNEIQKFHRAGIVLGIGSGRFAPGDNISYEHFGFLLDRLFGYKYENESQSFAKRQDVISALVKAMKLEDSKIEDEEILSKKFADSYLIDDENLSGMKIAAQIGLVIGYGSYVNPDSHITRAETVTLLYRAISRVYGITDSDLPEEYHLKINP